MKEMKSGMSSSISIKENNIYRAPVPPKAGFASRPRGAESAEFSDKKSFSAFFAYPAIAFGDGG